jgi:hypothetical protein
MNRRQLEEEWHKKDGLYFILLTINDEVERLKRFAKNVNTYGKPFVPEMINISEDHKRLNTSPAKK